MYLSSWLRRVDPPSLAQNTRTVPLWWECFQRLVRAAGPFCCSVWCEACVLLVCGGGVQVGRLWTALADFHIRRAAFEVARDVYEEGLAAVATVRDFGLIFDALR